MTIGQGASACTFGREGKRIRQPCLCYIYSAVRDADGWSMAWGKARHPWGVGECRAFPPRGEESSE
jgi:hypothetical protein